MEGLKYSRQRAAVLSSLRGRRDHPTAEMLYHDLVKSDEKISLGTVYRNLSVLAEKGVIERIHAGDGREHFDWDTKKHDHFLCRKCGALLDFPDRIEKEELLAKAGKAYEGKVEGYSLLFNGLCPSCAERGEA